MDLFFLVIGGFILLVAGVVTHALRFDQKATAKAAQARQDARPPQALEAWTPQEREVLGYNDTQALITQLDQALGNRPAYQQEQLERVAVRPKRRVHTPANASVSQLTYELRLAADEHKCKVCGRATKYDDAHMETFHAETLPTAL